MRANRVIRVTMDNSDVQSYLNILQGAISRLSGNSASIKTWCVTLVSAILVVAIENSLTNSVLVALLPVIVFLLLDAYYLSLEQDFRDCYKGFVQHLHDESLEEHHFYKIELPSKNWHRMKVTLESIGSSSVWPFYLLLVLAILMIWINP